MTGLGKSHFYLFLAWWGVCIFSEGGGDCFEAGLGFGSGLVTEAGCSFFPAWEEGEPVEEVLV